MDKWSEQEDSLYYLHAQVNLLAKAENLHLMVALVRHRRESIKKASEVILELGQSLCSAVMQDRLRKQFKQLLSLALTLLIKHQQTEDQETGLAGEMQQYTEEIQQLLKQVELAENGRESQNAGVTPLETKGLLGDDEELR